MNRFKYGVKYLFGNDIFIGLIRSRWSNNFLYLFSLFFFLNNFSWYFSNHFYKHLDIYYACYYFIFFILIYSSKILWYDFIKYLATIFIYFYLCFNLSLHIILNFSKYCFHSEFFYSTLGHLNNFFDLFNFNFFNNSFNCLNHLLICNFIIDFS